MHANGVLDQDIQPRDRMLERIGDRVDLAVGIDGDEAGAAARLADVDADVVFVTSRVPLSRRVLEASDLRVAGKIGTGIDNVDLDAARELGIDVTYTPGVNALSVAEHTVGLLLAVKRRTVAAHRTLEVGGWRDEFPTGTLLSGTTVGVVGLGNVGRRVASILRGFDTTTLAHDPYVDEIDAEPVHAELVGFEPLLERADAVVVNAELTAETRGMIDGPAFARMKPGAVLVNTARGPIVDEDALVGALRDGELAGAGLDVFAEEPLDPASPLHGFDDVVLTPHVAAATESTRRDAIDRLAANALTLLDGGDVPDRYRAA